MCVFSVPSIKDSIQLSEEGKRAWDFNQIRSSAGETFCPLSILIRSSSCPHTVLFLSSSFPLPVLSLFSSCPYSLFVHSLSCTDFALIPSSCYPYSVFDPSNLSSILPILNPVLIPY